MLLLGIYQIETVYSGNHMSPFVKHPLPEKGVSTAHPILATLTKSHSVFFTFRKILQIFIQANRRFHPEIH